jgi:hypothetical protein
MKKLTSGRVNVKATAAAVQIDWSEDYWGYDYADQFVTDWVLNNC